jgi:hypothetical protein
MSKKNWQNPNFKFAVIHNISDKELPAEEAIQIGSYSLYNPLLFIYLYYLYYFKPQAQESVSYNNKPHK